MVRLTAELINHSAQFTNPLKEREIDLRSNKIKTLENLGATLDIFDVVDLSDNEIRKLDGFPLLRRLTSLLLSNNKINKIEPNLSKNLPNLVCLVAANNGFTELGQLKELEGFANSLEFISLIRNPVTNKKYYRNYLIHLLPKLRVIDFSRVKTKEREETKLLFSGSSGAALLRELSHISNEKPQPVVENNHHVNMEQ
eukprot:Sdes_comp20656_c0_seq1m15950